MGNRSNPKTKYLLFAIVVIGIIFSAFVLTSLMPRLSVAGGSGLGLPNLPLPNIPLPNIPLPNITLPKISSEKVDVNGSTFEIFGVTQTRYIRTYVGETYQSGNWTIASDTNSSLYNGDYLSQKPTVFTNVSYGSVIIKGEWNGFIPALYYSKKIDLANATAYYYPQLHVFTVVDKFNQSYTDEYAHYWFNESLLNAKSVDTQVSANYLEVPANLTTTLQSVIDKINLSQASSDYEKIILIRDYLKANYVYDLNYTRAPSGQDPVQWFLLNETRGVCANFNSAFVLLLRYVGVPSRLVTGYSINATAEYQKVTCNQAHAWAEVAFNDLGWVEFDATAASNASSTSPTPTLKSTNTTITSSPSFIVRGNPFNTEGVVTDSNGNPLSGLEVTITLKINKNDPSGFVCGLGTTDANGIFNVVCQVPNNVSPANYQVIAFTHANNIYAASDSDPETVLMIGTKINVTPIGSPAVDQPFSIYAQLIENDTYAPIANKTLTLSYTVDSIEKQVVATTNETGYVILSFETIPQTTDNKLNYIVYFNETDNYLSSEFDGQLNIISSTPEIDLTSTGPATVGQPYNITAQLTDSDTGLPIPDALLKLVYSVGGQLMQIFATTNASGFATFSIPSIPQIGDNKLDYTVSFDQAGSLLSTEANGQLDINSAAQSSFFDSPLFYAIVIAAIASAAAVIGFFFYKKRKSRLIGPSPAIPVAIPVNIVEAKNSNTDLLKIVFPLIKPPFPDVWGVGELFQAEIHLKKNESPTNGVLDVQFGDEQFRKLSTQSDGIAKIDFQTNKKGIYVLTAKYSQSGKSDLVVKRSIKIVDYTEEIVSIYKETFDLEKSKGVPIGEETSPREFQAALLQNLHFEDKSPLNSFVEIFEIADYSLYNLGRADYEKMFLSAISVNEAVKEAAQPKQGVD